MPRSSEGLPLWRKLKEIVRDRLYASGKTRNEVVRNFHRLYYDSWHHLGGQTVAVRWLGHKTLKCPMDLWILQEILVETRPDLVIETGTYEGGSALFCAGVLDLLGGTGRVLSIDTREPSGWPTHERLTYLTGPSTSAEILDRVRAEATASTRVLVCLDSDHSFDHVASELEAYADLVTIGSYLIVEDTNVNGHPVYPDHGPGPMEAVHAFLAADSRFQIDASRERLLLTMNPNGYLRRVD